MEAQGRGPTDGGVPGAVSCGLDGLLGQIAGQAAAGGPERAPGAWSVSGAQVRQALGVAPADYYRRIAAAEAAGDRLVGPAASAGTFSQENVGELVSLLELFCGPQAERSLREAGIFFSTSDQADILQVFHELVGREVSGHRLRGEEFSAMLRAFGDWQRAAAVYLREYLPVQALIRRAAESYCAGRRFGLPELAVLNAAGVLEYFFRRHVLEEEALLQRVRVALFAQAVREGHAQAPRGQRQEQRHGEAEAEAGGDDEAGGGADARTRDACRVMSIEASALSLPLLRRQYKRLVKRWHPDVNPQGLRRCQQINAAYALLLARLEAGA